MKGLVGGWSLWDQTAVCDSDVNPCDVDLQCVRAC